MPDLLPTPVISSDVLRDKVRALLIEPSPRFRTALLSPSLAGSTPPIACWLQEVGEVRGRVQEPIPGPSSAVVVRALILAMDGRVCVEGCDRLTRALIDLQGDSAIAGYRWEVDPGLGPKTWWLTSDNAAFCYKATNVSPRAGLPPPGAPRSIVRTLVPALEKASMLDYSLCLALAQAST